MERLRYLLGRFGQAVNTNAANAEATSSAASAEAAAVDLAEKLAGLVHSMIAKLATTSFYEVPSNHDSHPKLDFGHSGGVAGCADQCVDGGSR